MVVLPIILWLCGYIGAFYLFPISDSLQTGFAVSAVMTALGAACVFRAPQFKVNVLTYAMMGLWAVAAVSCAMSDVKFVSLTFLYFFSALPMTFLLFSIIETQIVLKIIRGVLLVLGVSALIQFFFMPHMLKFGGTHWPFADNNSLGALIAVGAILFWGDALRGDKWKWLNVAATVIMFAAIMTTEGRAVVLAFAGVFVVMTILVRPVPRQTIGIFLACVLILLGTMTSSELSIPHWFGEGGKTIQSFENADVDEPNMLTGSRFMIWKSTFDIFMAHPFTGTGIGTFFIYYPEYRNPLDDSAGYMAHNDVLQFASDMGFAAPLLALFIVGFVVFQTFIRIGKINNRHDKLNLVIPFSAIILVTGHSLVNFNFYILPSLMTTGLMLAVWNKQIATRSVTGLQNKTLRESVAIFGVVLCMIPLWGISVSEYQVGKATKELEQLDAQGFADSLQIADTTGMGLNGRVYLQAAIFAIATKDDTRALALLDRAERVNPRMTQIYVERSKLFLKERNKDAAWNEANKALIINPSFISARMQAADVLDAMGKHKDAYDVLKAGMTGRMRSPNPEEYYKRVADTARKFGDKETRDLALERINP